MKGLLFAMLNDCVIRIRMKGQVFVKWSLPGSNPADISRERRSSVSSCLSVSAGYQSVLGSADAQFVVTSSS
jgi:hypothetical protein